MSNMLRTILVVTLLFVPMSVSFAQEKPAQPVLRVAVMADGRVAVNGAPATIQSLRESLKLSQQKGVVRYYREAANTEGHL
jgi:biopolymer transport protein ExbD